MAISNVNSTKSQILRVIEPDLELLGVKPIVIRDDNQSEGVAPTNAKRSEQGVKLFPQIKIGNITFHQDQIQYFKLSSDSFRPTLDLMVQDDNGYFNDLMFPKDGDVISIRISASDEDSFKSIRCDFNILDLRVLGSNRISMSGILAVPNEFRGEKIETFPDLSSYDLLLSLSENYGFGYATNEEATNDVMTWICPNISTLDWIQDVTLHSYKDETSFFTSFLDFYYFVNFVNLQNQFSTQEGTEETSTSFSSLLSSFEKDVKNPEGHSDNLFLTNLPAREGTNSYISEWRSFTRWGDIVDKNGYKRFAQFFDRELYEFQSHFVDPLTTEGLESNRILQKGKPGDFSYQKNSKYKWLGDQDNFNTHDNYAFSIIQNIQNIQDGSKTGLEITLSSPNHRLQRFGVVPIVIYELEPLKSDELEERDKILNEEVDPKQSEEQRSPKINTIISGHYVISEIGFEYDPIKGLYQNLTLLRREWPIQKKK